MKSNSKILLAVLVATTTLCTASFGQTQTMVAGKSVTGVTLDLKKFHPQIDTSPRLKHVEKDHEAGFKVPFGTPNNLISGGALTDPRISLASNALFPGISATGWEPPDPDIAVGPNHIVEVVNSTIAIFTKAGTKVFEQTGQNFFASVSPESFDFDPKVIYDQVAKRFIYVDLGLNDQSSGGTASLLIGVSNTSDPTGTWKVFKVDVKQTNGSNNYWWDYPGMGYNKDMISFSGNMFAMQGSSGFNGVQLVSFDKTTLYAGTATPFKTTVSDAFTIQLAKTEDSTSNSVYGVETHSQTSMRLTAITKNGSNHDVTQAVVAVPFWSGDQGFVTGPGGIKVQTDGDRTFVAASRLGHVLSSHTVAVSGSDGSPAARWYDFKTNNWPTSGTPTLFQSGQLDPPAGHGYLYPAINMDSKGGYGMAFSMVGSSTPGKLMGTGRKPSDPPGTMGLPILLENSTAAQYNGFSTRWGDYHDVELDPVDSRTFWAVGMGAGAQGRWQTFIKSFLVSPSDADLIPVLASGVTTVAGTLISGSKASLTNVDSVNLSIQSQAVSGLGQVGGFNAVYQLPFTGAVDTLRAYVTASGPNGSSALISLLNKNTGKYDQLSSMGLSQSGSSKILDLTPAQIALYVSSTNQVSMIVRGVNPSRSNAVPIPFMFNTDQAILRTAAVQ